jgi:hypothetical protein
MCRRAAGRRQAASGEQPSADSETQQNPKRTGTAAAAGRAWRRAGRGRRAGGVGSGALAK